MPLSLTVTAFPPIRGSSSNVVSRVVVKVLRVAVVDADQVGADRQGALHLIPAVHLDENPQSELAPDSEKVLQLPAVHQGDDQEHRVGANDAWPRAAGTGRR